MADTNKDIPYRVKDLNSFKALTYAEMNELMRQIVAMYDEADRSWEDVKPSEIDRMARAICDGIDSFIEGYQE